MSFERVACAAGSWAGLDGSDWEGLGWCLRVDRVEG